MADATMSRARLRDLACLGRGQPTDAGGAGLRRPSASRRRAAADTATGIGDVTSPRPRAASSRPETDDLTSSAISIPVTPNQKPLAAVVMAAGLGTRLRSKLPKHLHLLLGRRLMDWPIDAGRALDPKPLVVVLSPETAEAAGDLDGIETALQAVPRGTGDAVASARGALEGFHGDVLVLSGDTPLLTPELLRRLVAEHRRAAADVTVLSFEPA